MDNEVKVTSIVSAAVVLSFGIFGLVALKGCELSTSRDAVVGKACVDGGGSWVPVTGEKYQCIRGVPAPNA